MSEGRQLDLVQIERDMSQVSSADRAEALSEYPIRLSPLPQTPTVSILMANRNYGAYIGAAIDSVLDQTYQHFELLICDDASTDESIEIIAERMESDSRIRLMAHEQAGGQGAALDELFSMSRGEIICFLDSDDRFAPGKLSRVVETFQADPNVGVLTHEMRIVDSKGNYLGPMTFRTRVERGWIGPAVIRRGGRLNLMGYGGLCLRREVAKRIFPVPEPVRTFYSDGYVTMLGAILSEITSIPELLYDYRVHDSNVMQRDLRDQSVSEHEIEGMNRQIESTNERLQELGLSYALLDGHNNLNFQQHLLLLGLFRGEPRRQLIGRFRALFPLLRSDDLYPASDKIIRAAIYAIAIPLPLAIRTWWLLVSRSPQRFMRLFTGRLPLIRNRGEQRAR